MKKILPLIPDFSCPAVAGLAKFGIIILAAVLMWPLVKGGYAADYTGEKIIYEVNLLGTAEYHDLGIVDFKGEKAKKVTFRTQVMGFDDTETIYSDPVNLLPLCVQRDISMWLSKEYLVEDYDPKRFSLVIKKFKDKKQVKEYVFQEDGPIHNAVMLPFYLRNVADLDIGWSFVARFPAKFEIKLVSIEEIEVPAGKFTAYYFKSNPEKFEIWISKDKLRIPLKIKDTGGFGYTMLLKERKLK